MELLPSELKTPPLGAVALVGLPSVHASISAHLRSELRPPLHRRVRWAQLTLQRSADACTDIA